jgi:hypothetical protein
MRQVAEYVDTKHEHTMKRHWHGTSKGVGWPGPCDDTSVSYETLVGNHHRTIPNDNDIIYKTQHLRE